MKKILAYLVLVLALASAGSAFDGGSGEVEAITIVSLPVDSVTIYPDGLATVKRTGEMEVTEGIHKFVLDLPRSVNMASVRFTVTNATVGKVVYDDNPEYTINVSSAGVQNFELVYLMPRAGLWMPSYSVHLEEETVMISAQAVVENNFGEELEAVRLKLVSGPPQAEPLALLREAVGLADYAAAEEAAPMAYAPKAAPAPATGELETLYIYELDGRKDLEMDKEVGFPLFEEAAPITRSYLWDAYYQNQGPVTEVVRANNTMKDPWPAGSALLYKNGEYVSEVKIPFTPTGTEAEIEVGSSSDLKVSRKLANYTSAEEIVTVAGAGNASSAMKVTTETWTYHLTIKSNLDRNATAEVSDRKPLKAEMISAVPEPKETTATGLEWELELLPREEVAIDYTYRVVTKEVMASNK
ncbi:DUF4139 domain-containing protein [Methanocrinis sp.]|uniref:DUF4139 domain-containing protein n=1 Tax=Methanocrinis sp. TaxID=3101522 RepID=UPI003D0D00FB